MTAPTAGPRPASAWASPPADARDGRVDFYRQVGATADEAAELCAYARDELTERAWALRDAPGPLSDEPFVAVWEEYAAEAAATGAADTLRRHLVQLRFPIADDTSEDPRYQAATRRGQWAQAPDGPDDGVRFLAPDAIRLFLHPTAAGQLPVIVAGARADFVALVQALTRRNAPHAIPDAVGASMVAGFNNWERVHRLRRAWDAAHPGAGDAAWSAEFRLIAARPELYQDRFVLLSRGAYSGVPASAFGLDAAAWDAMSLTIRLEHECTHYFTRRVLGSMRNALLDELAADYAGLAAATGGFRAAWFLRFMGLEAFPRYRAGGRMEQYRGTPPLSDGAFRVLGQVVVRAAEQLEAFDASRPPTADATAHAQVCVAILRVGLERLATDDGAAALRDALPILR